jgi:hypothetical protein
MLGFARSAQPTWLVAAVPQRAGAVIGFVDVLHVASP